MKQISRTRHSLPSESIIAENCCVCNTIVLESEYLQYTNEGGKAVERRTTRVLQRAIARRTSRSFRRQAAPVPLQGKTGAMGRPPHDDSILQDKARAVREIQGCLPVERHDALRSLKAGDRTPHRGPVTAWWELGPEFD